ncbi:hypothetical protein [Ruegeria sp. A3M17]|uniref:hypothetical protein n=1 Tax=Ruegeria sp. A3M17 TaxID=2267229 RepID=UPI0011BE36E9|nr:hypothetical protein [Ruegeria sp. A3M17]
MEKEWKNGAADDGEATQPVSALAALVVVFFLQSFISGTFDRIYLHSQPAPTADIVNEWLV